jgi:hypothetical protein
MELQNKIDKKKEIIYKLAEDIHTKVGRSDIQLDEIITILLIIILMNFPTIKTPKDINTMLIRIFDKDKNNVFKIPNLPYNVMVEPPVMSLENYFRLMKEQLENIHKPKIIAIDSEEFLSKLSK